MTTNPHPPSLDAAFDLLTSMMQDPMKADICSVRMSIAADRINQALENRTAVSAKIKLAKSHPEFLRAGIRFLASRRSPQEFETMMNRLELCHCDFSQMGMRRLHTPSGYRTSQRSVGPDLIHDTMGTVTECIIMALSELSQHKFRTGNASNGGQRWPQGPEDLLPFGPKDAVVGLEHWVTKPPNGCIIFKLAGSLALSYAPFAKEVLQDPNFTFALARPCKHLEAAVKFYHEGDSSPLARMRFFTYPITAVLQFFDELAQFDTPQYNRMIISCGERLKPILTPLTTILSTLPGREWSQTQLRVDFLISLANAKLDRNTGVASVRFDRSRFAEALGLQDPVGVAFNVMVKARKMGCWNIQCPSQSEVLPLRLCGRCNLIRFCGEKCQKDAWKSTSLPHKELCAKIYTLKEALGSADWSLLWTPGFRVTQFQAMCRTKNIDAEAVAVIERTISALRLRKTAFLDNLKNTGASQNDPPIRAQLQSRASQNYGQPVSGETGID